MAAVVAAASKTSPFPAISSTEMHTTAVSAMGSYWKFSQRKKSFHSYVNRFTGSVKLKATQQTNNSACSDSTLGPTEQLNNTLCSQSPVPKMRSKPQTNATRLCQRRGMKMFRRLPAEWRVHMPLECIFIEHGILVHLSSLYLLSRYVIIVSQLSFL